MWFILQGLIFHTGKVSELWRKTVGNNVFLRCFKVENNVPAPENEKVNV